jgi:long-chain fatty acid transport protein
MLRVRMSIAFAGVAAAMSSPASAGWIQSFGQSERCIALGGACAAKADDFGAYYQNPAAAASFQGAVVGGNLRIIDTTFVDLKDSAGNHEVDATNTEGEVVAAPTLAAYMPVTDQLTLGVGVGAPFAITADWENDSGIHRFDMADQSLFVLDVTPMAAYKVTDRLLVGAGLNVVAFKQLRTQTLIPDSFVVALPPALGGAGAIIPTTPNSPVVGSITIQSDRDVNLGIPPEWFEPSFDEFAVTLGMQYQVNDRLKIGAVYRSKTPVTFTGDLTLDLSPVGGGTQVVGYSTDIDMPAHLQVGFAYDVIPKKLNWSFDVQWTNWADAKGIGTPLVVSVDQPLLGFINDLQVDYSARNTFTFRTGLEYAVDDHWTLLAGYAYDQSIFDDQHVDILVYDSNRHLLSAGIMYDTRDNTAEAGWTTNLGIHATIYEDRNIAAGESQNLGGLSLPVLVDGDTLGFSPNREPFGYGGAILAAGVSLQYSFGAH